MTRRHWCVALVAVCAAASPPTMAAQTPARADGWVVLTVPEYHALRVQAHPPDAPPAAPPVDAAITQVAYELVAAGEVATGSADITIDVLKDGWVSVPLPRGLHIREARLAGAPLAIVDGPEGSGTRAVLLSRQGRSLVALDLVVPLSARAGVESLALPASSGGLVSAALTVPRADLEVIATGGLIVDRTPAGPASKVVAYASPGQPLVLSWQRKRNAARTAMPLRLRTTIQQIVGLGDEIGHVTARVTVEVIQGATTALTVALPPGLVVNQVQGPLVADWDVQAGTLRITLVEPADRTVSAILTAEFRPPAAGRVEVPLVHVPGVERETGGVAVEVLGAGEVTAHEARGLDPADPSDLGDLLAGRTSPALAVYRYRGQQAASRALALTVSRYTPQAVLLATVDEARYRVLMAEDGKALIETRLAVRNNQRSFLGVVLPAGAALWSAAVDGRPVRPGRGPGGTLLVPLRKRRAGEQAAAFAVDLVYVDRDSAWGRRGERGVSLPAIDLPVSRTGVAVYHSPRFRVALQPTGAFREQAWQPPTAVVLRETAEEGRAGGLGLGFGSAGGSGGGGVFRRDGQNVAASGDEQQAVRELKGLVDRFQREARGARTAGVLPVRVQFPAAGPSLFLATELTPEGLAPQARITFTRTVK